MTSILLLQRLADWASNLCQVHDLDGESQTWVRALLQCAVEHRDDLAHLAPWTLLPPPPEALWRLGSVERTNWLEDLREWLRRLENTPTLRQVAELPDLLLPLVDDLLAELHGPDSGDAASPEDSAVSAWLANLHGAILDASLHALERIRALEADADHCRELSTMDFSFLFDESRDLLAIGYNVGDHRMDTGFYDLLASEARLASFYAISQGQVGQEHWFALGRLLTASRGAPALLSWSGSMFEYLMPLLVMPTYENTLLNQTYKAVVRGRSNMGSGAKSLGGFRSPVSTHGTRTSSTSIGPSGCRGWD